jgi:hypothetical protein
MAGGWSRVCRCSRSRSGLVWTGTASPGVAPAVVAVESWFSDGVCVASAWPLGGSQVLVGVECHRTVADAAGAVSGVSAGQLLVGKSIAKDPAWAALLVEPVGSTTKQAVTTLRQLVDDDVLRHDGGEVLSGQVLALRTLPGADGPRVRSTGRADAVKAAAWAVESARAATEVPAIF